MPPWLELVGAIQNLQAQLSALQVQNVALQTHLALMAAQALVPQEPKVPLPDNFSGNCGQFPTDQDQVGLIISLLTEEALAWASPLLEQSSPFLGQLEQFTRAMSVIFSDPHQTTEPMLQMLQRGH
uniref:DUF4939 domain-containing protein n=1 Tax=Chrysemys picta bellii TaxID=8478 RepID=A0A8C3J022_CHRPI